LIEIKDCFKGKPQFTNKFLLDHSTKSFQLFHLANAQRYIVSTIHTLSFWLTAASVPALDLRRLKKQLGEADKEILKKAKD
jgi:hypothetical protein